MRAKLFAVAVAASSILAVSVPAAHASSPSGGCPPAFQGPMTFAELIAKYPPPPDLPDPEGVLAGYDRNGDELLCVQEVPQQNPMGPINVIDNTTAT